MSADPFVQAPYNSQSYNRYSYVFNNPLSFTDPSGFVSMSMVSYIYADYAGQRGPSVNVEEVKVIGRRGGDYSTLSGDAAYNFSQVWQNYMNRYQQSMLNMGGFWGGVGYTSIGTLDGFLVSDALNAIDSTLNGDTGGAVYGAAVTVIKPLKAAEKVADLANDAKKTEKRVEKALQQKVETPHTVVKSGDAPKTSTPNSIYEISRADGSKSITYYDDKGRAFSREDYGQQRPHKPLVKIGDDGRAAPHEHRYEYSDYGPVGSYVRLLDPKGLPISDWFKD